MDGEDSPLQSLQRGPKGRILQVEAHYHPQSRQYVVLWDDILEVFPNATNVLHGTVVVSRARDADLRLIEPRCIRYQSGRVLAVVVGEELNPALGGTGGELSTLDPTPMTGGMVFSQQQLTYKNIEQWTAMTTPEDMLMGGMYAPTICTVTTTKTRPFKPLKLPTETEADASSIRTISYKGAHDQDEEDDSQGPSRKCSLELEDGLAEEDDKSEGTPGRDKPTFPTANPFRKLYTMISGTKTVNRPYSKSSGRRSSGGAQTLLTSSPLSSTTTSLISPTQLILPPSSTPSKTPDTVYHPEKPPSSAKSQVTIKLSIMRYERADASSAIPAAAVGTVLFSEFKVIAAGNVNIEETAYSHVEETETKTQSSRTIKWMKDEHHWKREAGMLQHLKSGYITELFSLRSLPTFAEYRFVSILGSFSRTLESYIQTETLSSHQIRQMTLSFSDALRWCHEHHVVHLNVRPASFYLEGVPGADAKDGNGQLIWKLWNFGHARFVGEVVNTAVTTVTYAAPEIWTVLKKADTNSVTRTNMGPRIITERTSTGEIRYIVIGGFTGNAIRVITERTTSGEIRLIPTNEEIGDLRHVIAERSEFGEIRYIIGGVITGNSVTRVIIGPRIVTGRSSTGEIRYVIIDQYNGNAIRTKFERNKETGEFVHTPVKEPEGELRYVTEERTVTGEIRKVIGAVINGNVTTTTRTVSGFTATEGSSSSSSGVQIRIVSERNLNGDSIFYSITNGSDGQEIRTVVEKTEDGGFRIPGGATIVGAGAKMIGNNHLSKDLASVSMIGNNDESTVLASVSMDRWSLGLILYELYTKKAYFASSFVAKFALTNKKAFKPALEDIWENDARKAILGLLETDPEKRYTLETLREVYFGKQ